MKDFLQELRTTRSDDPGPEAEYVCRPLVRVPAHRDLGALRSPQPLGCDDAGVVVVLTGVAQEVACDHGRGVPQYPGKVLRVPSLGQTVGVHDQDTAGRQGAGDSTQGG